MIQTIINFLTNNLVLGCALTLFAFGLICTMTKGERRELQNKKPVQRKGMITAYIKILKAMFCRRVLPHHLPGIARSIDNFRAQYQYNQPDRMGNNYQDCYDILMEQFRDLSERVEPESHYHVAASGGLILDY